MRIWALLLISFVGLAQKIDRKAVVERHIVTLNQVDTLGALSVGNGHFAFTVDVTGLQSFPMEYSKGIPLGTQADWGWHAFPNTSNFKRSETYRDALYAGRKVSYALQGHQNVRKDSATEYFRQNPHRIHLGHWGFRIYSKTGKVLGISDLKSIVQRLNPYTGEIHSHFEVDGIPVDVSTFALHQDDGVQVKVKSTLLKTGQLRFFVDYPFPSQSFVDEGGNYQEGGHFTNIQRISSRQIQILHNMDRLSYQTFVRSSVEFRFKKELNHHYELSPISCDEIQFAVSYGHKPIVGLKEARVSNRKVFEHFWKSGGMIDFSKTNDPRAKELERRMILSLYLTRIQSVGNEPPQETGLTYNSWYGRPHLEMTWWHLMHFGYWGRSELMEPALKWYEKNLGEARKLAGRQGFAGVRWQKMTDPTGGESPSSVGSFLLWQQPHIIEMLDLIAQSKPISFRKRYAKMVQETAEGMYSLMSWDDSTKTYRLGPGFIPAQESLPYAQTYNAPLELAAWYQGLKKAQDWRISLGLKPVKEWDEAFAHFPTLPEFNGIYQAAAGIGDGYQNPRFVSDHPAVLGAMGMLGPLPSTDTLKMNNTLQKILKTWNWASTWGWDYPLMAMTAVRLKDADLAVNLLLMPQEKNRYLINGHNYQDKRLRLYLPGNGGLLMTLAWMAKGSLGNSSYVGFPQEWHVEVDGFGFK